MEKVLELFFMTETGKTAKITINDPKEPVDLDEVKQAMEAIIQANVFYTSSGSFVNVKNARLIARNIETYSL